MKKILLILISFYYLFIHLYAKTWIVSKDTNSDFSTITSAISNSSTGDTIYIKSGIYNEMIYITKGGTKNSYFTIIGDSINKPIIDATGLDGDYIIEINNQNFIILKNLEIQGTPTGSDPTGVLVRGSCSNIIIENLKIHDIKNPKQGAHGIHVYANSGDSPSSNIIIKENEIYDCQLGYSEAITLNGNVDGFLVENNIIHDIDNIGIDMAGFWGVAPYNDQARNGVCRRNFLYNITSKDNPAYNGYISCAAIYVDGGRKIVIEQNIIKNGDFGISIGSENKDKITDSVFVRNNLIYFCNKDGIIIGGSSDENGWAKNCYFYNNTLFKNSIHPDVGWAQLTVQRAENNYIFNNIIYTSDKNIAFADYTNDSIEVNHFDYNLFYSDNPSNIRWEMGGIAMDFDNYRSITSFGEHSMLDDPLFIDTASYNFRLQESSPAIDKGDPDFFISDTILDLDGNKRVNNIVDLGCYEFYSATYITNLNNNNLKTTINVFPNPFNPILNIEVYNKYKNAVIKVININGKIIKTFKLKFGYNKIKFSGKNLSSGIYFIALDNKKDFILKKVVLVK